MNIDNKNEWKDVPGYINRYVVNKEGNIFSIRRNLILTGTTDRKGYTQVRLTNDDGITLTQTLHRIIAKVFIPNPESKPQVNHINGVKTDNRVINLEWVTNRENRDHALVNNLVNDNCKPKPIYVIHIDTNTIQKVNSSYDAMKLLYPNLKIMCNEFKSKQTKIKEILVGKRKSQNGYTFKYVNDNII